MTDINNRYKESGVKSHTHPWPCSSGGVVRETAATSHAATYGCGYVPVTPVTCGTRRPLARPRAGLQWLGQRSSVRPSVTCLSTGLQSPLLWLQSACMHARMHRFFGRRATLAFCLAVSCQTALTDAYLDTFKD
jgi:hypothetical protein